LVAANGVVRHALKVARSPNQKPGEDNLCVLKGFMPGDVKGLRRSLGALAGLKHCNIIQLQVLSKIFRKWQELQPCNHLIALFPFHVCQAVTQHEGIWFLQFPYYPSDMRKWLGELSEAELEPAERTRRVMGVARGVLQGLAYLHQVRPILGWHLRYTVCIVCTDVLSLPLFYMSCIM
jgi:hypothetical protein